jgi:putative PEP-CTERM system histidine kinase
MELATVLSYSAAGASLILAVFVLYRDWHSFVHRIFAVGMLVLAVDAIFTGLSIKAIMPEDVAYWLRVRNFSTSLLPGIWLLFSLSFSRANYKKFISRWKWIAGGLFLLPLATVVFFSGSFFIDNPLLSPSLTWLVRIGWSGYTFNFFILVSAIIVLMNLERTLRNSIGHMRWQIKFMILGVGCIFAVRIYTSSQTMLFHALNTSLELVNTGALLLGGILIAWSLLRTRLLNVDVFLSQSFLYNSFTVLFVGVYLIVVGALAKLALYFDSDHNIPFSAFFILLALLGLFTLLLSDRLRRKMKGFISRHFQRPLYDYRMEWSKFTGNTVSVTDIKKLCNVVVNMMSKTFDVLSVTIWILDESGEQITIGGSTVFSKVKPPEIKSIENEMIEFTKMIRHTNLPFDFDYSKENLPNDFRNLREDFFTDARIRYCIPLTAGESLLGILTVSNRVGGDDLSVEDFDLLVTMADQVAANLQNLMLSERLREAREMEAFQKMSAFFVHDLKNLASKLSLTMQNLPIHFDNPEFRSDALQSISQSVDKIKLMSSRLTSFSQKLAFHPAEATVNDVVTATLAGLDGSLRGKITEQLQPVPPVEMDSEQIQNVLINLILNANEATGESGEIAIVTGQKDGWVFVAVQDNGSGMPQEFIEKSLFHPFQTTKKNGMGIGLYHSKTIVEAHKGRIEVKSEEGKGSTFRVVLPLGKK